MMNKNGKVHYFNPGVAFYLACIFAVMTAVALTISQLQVESTLAFPFMLLYVFYTFVLLIAFPIIGYWNARYYKKVTLRNKWIKFLLNGLGLFFALHLMLMVFYPSKINLLREVPNSGSLALGLSFFDVVLSRRQDSRQDRGGKAHD